MAVRYRVSDAAKAAMDVFAVQGAQFLSLIDETREALMADYEELRAQWDEASEGWQNGDRGAAVDEWLTAYESLGDALEQVHDTLDPAVSDVEQMEAKP